MRAAQGQGAQEDTNLKEISYFFYVNWPIIQLFFLNLHQIYTIDQNEQSNSIRQDLRDIYSRSRD